MRLPDIRDYQAEIVIDPNPTRRKGRVTRRTVEHATSVVEAMNTGGYDDAGESLVLLKLFPESDVRSVLYDRLTSTAPTGHHDDADRLNVSEQLRPYAHWQIALSLGMTSEDERLIYDYAMRTVRRYNRDPEAYDQPIRQRVPTNVLVFPGRESPKP